jgi:hypothetical protein
MRGYYRALSKRFPYAIYYKIEDNTLVVMLSSIAGAAHAGSPDVFAEANSACQRIAITSRDKRITSDKLGLYEASVGL